MPKVPEYSQRVGDPGVQAALPRTATPTPQLNTRMAQDAAKFLTERAAIEREEEQKANATWGLEAETKVLRNKNNLLNDPDKGLYTYKGKNAQEGSRKIASERESFYQDIEATAVTPGQKEIARRLIMRDRVRFDGDIVRYSRAETQKYRRKTAVDNLEEKFRDLYNNPLDTEERVKDIKAVATEIAKMEGEDKSFVVRMMSGAHKAVISGTLRNGDYQRAEDYYNKHKKSLVKDDDDLARKMLTETRTNVMSRGIGEQYLLLERGGTPREDVMRRARQIPEKEVRDATLKYLRTAHRDMDAAKKHDQSNRFEQAALAQDEGRPIDPETLATLTNKQRDALKEIRRRRLVSDPEAYRMFHNLTTPQLKEMTDAEFTVVTAKLNLEDHKAALKIYTGAKNDAVSFKSEKLVDGEIRQQMLNLEMIDDFDDIKKGDEAELYMAINHEVQRRVLDWKAKNPTKKEVPPDEIENIVKKVVNMRALTRQGLIWKTDEYMHVLHPDFREQTISQAQVTPRMRRLWETYVADAQRRGIRIRSDDDDRRNEFYIRILQSDARKRSR